MVVVEVLCLSFELVDHVFPTLFDLITTSFTCSLPSISLSMHFLGSLALLWAMMLM